MQILPGSIEFVAELVNAIEGYFTAFLTCTALIFSDSLLIGENSPRALTGEAYTHFSDCESEGCRFESYYPRLGDIAQRIERQMLTCFDNLCGESL